MKTARICILTLLTAIFLNVFCLAQQPVSAPQQTQPYTPQDINLILRRNVGRDITENDLAARIQRLSIAFDPTPEIVSRFRFNGAHPHLINTIKRA